MANKEYLNNISSKILNSFPKMKSIDNRIENLNIIDNIKQLIELKTDIFELQNYVHLKITGSHQVSKNIFNKTIESINDRIKQLANSKFYDNVILMQNYEMANGYHLYNLTYNIMSYDEYMNALIIWNNDYVTDHDFKYYYDKNACSEFSRVDSEGKLFQEFWQYPVGTFERSNASILTNRKNEFLLYNLPYPKSFILKSIEIACYNQQESVRFCNFICEWMKRKIEQMTTF